MMCVVQIRTDVEKGVMPWMYIHWSWCLFSPTQVIFVGEEAVDAGGVRKEFFLLIMRELLDPKYGMFRYYEESRLIWFANKVHC